MTEELKKPEVKPADWISIGKGYPSVPAVVCTVYEKNNSNNGDLEVVYLNGSKAINEDVIWDKDHWKFKNDGPCGGYADNYDRLSEFVQILRGGRRF